MNVLALPPRPAKILGHLPDVRATAADPDVARRAEHSVRRAIDAASRDDLLTDIAVKFDGHVIRRGAGHLDVAVHDTTRDHVDHHPIAVIHLGDETVATRPSRHRTRAAGVGFSTDIDPRSGRFILATPACTTIAADASTAIVISQILTVLDPEEGQTFVEEYNTDLAASDFRDSAVRTLVLDPSGTAWRCGTWDSHETVLKTTQLAAR